MQNGLQPEDRIVCLKSIDVQGLSHHGVPIPLGSRIGPILATSGIGGKNPDTGEMPPDAIAQAANCFENLKSVLAVGGLAMGDVVKIEALASQMSARVRRTAHDLPALLGAADLVTAQVPFT